MRRVTVTIATLGLSVLFLSAPGLEISLPAKARLGTAFAQVGGFDDVPPWHWAADAVQKAAEAGIVIGYPRTDRDAAINAVTQVYEAFTNASHPAARSWAERFLVNLPANWPQPLQRSLVAGFRLSDFSVEVRGERQVVALTALVTLRTNGGLTESRARIRAEAQTDPDGRVRVNYATLAAAMPRVFR